MSYELTAAAALDLLQVLNSKNPKEDGAVDRRLPKQGAPSKRLREGPLMPRRTLAQSSFFDPEFVSPQCLVTGTVPWLLARRRSVLFPDWLLDGWRGGGRGRNAWPASVLMTLVLLRWSEAGMSRLASVRRARTDMGWRAAMGLALDDIVPSERTLRDFEQFLRRPLPGVGQSRHLLFHEHVVRMCVDNDVLARKPVWAMDSTPMWCYGAVLDTVRLLGDGLRKLARRWAKACKIGIIGVADAWKAGWILGKSTKGGLGINWRDPDERTKGLNRLAQDVLRGVEHAKKFIADARPSSRKSILALCAKLTRVVRDDLEADDQGRLGIARRVTSDRLISLTDPGARHGRKSKSHTFNGFKLHLVGDVVSGLITALAVTPGNQHDNRPAHRLIRRASEVVAGIEQILGDTAYGAAGFCRRVRSCLNIDVLAPPPPPRKPTDGRHSKADFDVDFEAKTVTCPNGVRSARFTHVQVELGLAERHTWSRDACDSCPLKAKCLSKGRRTRTVLLHPDEEEQRRSRERWALPAIQLLYRTRAQCERLINRVIRHGARQARAWGLGYAQFQAHATAATCNLNLLAQVLATGR